MLTLPRQIAVRERPILMGGPMVRAILEGRKTQTRRPVTHRQFGPATQIIRDASFLWAKFLHDKLGMQWSIKCPYGSVGDRLWVRETFCAESRQTIHYRADGWQYEGDSNSGWTPSIFMPRWASRLTLEIVNVRVERIQSISEGDAKAEGFPLQEHADDLNECLARYGGELKRSRAEISFGCTWDHLNAKRGFGWDKNPWCWCIEFKRL